MLPSTCASYLNRRDLFLNGHVVFLLGLFNFVLIHRRDHSCGQCGQQIAILIGTFVRFDATKCFHCAFHERIDRIDTKIVARNDCRIHEILLQPMLNADPSEVLVVQSFQIVLSLAMPWRIIIQFDGHRININACDWVTLAESLMNWYSLLLLWSWFYRHQSRHFHWKWGSNENALESIPSNENYKFLYWWRP